MKPTRTKEKTRKKAKPSNESSRTWPAEYFLNRELNWLEFNKRVIQLAADQQQPLLERLKFVAISASNLDEFFMKRIGGLKRQLVAGVQQRSRDGKTTREQLEDIASSVRDMVNLQHGLLMKDILPALADKGVRVMRYNSLTEAERAEADAYFTRMVFPVLTPLGVGPGHPFPFLSNLSLSLAVRLRLEDHDEPHFARIKVPSNRPRFITLKDGRTFVSMEDLIIAHIDALFPGAEVIEAGPFYITRNADIERFEEEAEDLVEAIHEELRHRKFAQMVRLVVHASMSADMREYLRSQLDLDASDVYVVPGLLRLVDLFQVVGADVPELKDTPWVPSTHPRLRSVDDSQRTGTIFDRLREGDLLVHHPYQSFDSSVLRLLEDAAEDPQVVTIKQTLYRTAKDSPIVKALIRASENGKQVAVLVEIKARFDEANNLRWVQELESAGVHVAYGLVGLKTHTKVMMVARDEEEGIRLYCHFGTGNYHTGTARLYTDIGYFVSDNRFGDDVTQLFNLLTGYNSRPSFSKLLVAPVNMRQRFIELIRAEAEQAKAGNPARIIAKMNQLEDEEIIHELYQASQAGVPIDLIVRGFCCLRPGVKGMSESIRVRSIVGRFLEHSRILFFENGGEHQYVIGSADWMRRNLDFRVELMAPVSDESARRELRAILDSALADTTNAWLLDGDGNYTRNPKAEPQVTHQIEMMQRVERQREEQATANDTLRFRAVSGPGAGSAASGRKRTGRV